MPAPSRRNKGEALATKVANASRIESLSDSRDRQAAHRARHATQWEEAAAVLSPVEQAIELTAHERREAKRVAQKAEMKALREVQAIEQSQAASQAAFARTLNVKCPQHNAGRGEPCWDSPRGACNRRARHAGYCGRR